MFKTQIHERDAYRGVFAFGGTLSGLDPKEVTNIPAALANARAFVAEVLAVLMTTATPNVTQVA
jgi:chromosome partitioning protein